MTEHVEYLLKVAYPFPELVQQLMDNPESQFTCDDFIKNLENAKNQKAYAIEGETRVEVPKKQVQLSIYRNYLATFYAARNECKLVNSLIKHTYLIDQKLYQVVDPNKQKEFIDSFNSLLQQISNSEFGQTQGYLRIIDIYIKINQNKY